MISQMVILRRIHSTYRNVGLPVKLLQEKIELIFGHFYFVKINS